MIFGDLLVYGHKTARSIGWVFRAFEDGGAFVYLVKHGHVEHLRPALQGAVDLFLIKRSFVTGYLVQRATAVHIVPAEAGKHHRRIVQAVFTAPIHIPLYMSSEFF